MPFRFVLVLIASVRHGAHGQAADPAEIDVVHVVSFSHLDVGYKYPYVAEVLSEWFKEWIPASIALSKQLRAAGGDVQHRWTMSPWVASLYMQCPDDVQWTAPGGGVGDPRSFPLHCPTAAEVEAFKAAVRLGDINFYASDFNTVYEYADADLLGFLSDFAHDVGRLAGQRHRSFVASQSDEPGVTRAAIPLLARRGVTALSVGVDELNNMPLVPRAFVWRDEGTGTELLVAWHNYGYGGGPSGRDGTWPGPYDPDAGPEPNRSGPGVCRPPGPPKGQTCNSTLTVPGLRHALALFVQNDNAGPPTRAQLEHYYAQVRSMFSNVQSIRSSTFEDFFVELEKVRHTLPVITHEIGDTWIDDPPSDPLLAAQFRAMMRARQQCIRDHPKECNASETASAFYNFSRMLIKNVEHDWGWHRNHTDRWSNAELQEDLASCRPNVATSPQPSSRPSSKCMSMISWMDQRAWGTTLPLRALGADHPLRSLVEQEFAALVRSRIDPDALGLKALPRGAWRNSISVCGGAEVRFDAAGAIDWLRTAGNGAIFANETNRLAELVVHVSSPEQRQAWAAAYMNEDPSTVDALDPSAGPVSGYFFKTQDPFGDGVGYRGSVDGMWTDGGINTSRVLLRSRLPTHVVSNYGGAEELWQEYRFRLPERKKGGVGAGGGCVIEVTVSAFNKTATRITESWWLRFHPATDSNHLDAKAMRLDKLGTLVHPLDVVFNGSKMLHGVSTGVTYGRAVGDPLALSVETLDVPVVKVGAGSASLGSDAPPLEGLNPAPVPNNRDPNLEAGFAFNLQNNLWNTNAIQWYPYDDLGKNMHFRFRIHLPESQPSMLLTV